MKKYLPYFFAACLVATGAVAKTNSWYVGAHGGLSLPTTYTDRTIDPEASQNTKTGFSLGATIGHSFDQWRFELEGSFRRSSMNYDRGLDSGTRVDLTGYAKHWLVMANLHYDIPVYKELDWSLGGGIGYARTELKFTSTAGTSEAKGDTLAWQIMTGPVWNINDHWSVGASYRLICFTTSRLDFNPEKSRYSDAFLNSFEAVVRYSF